MSNETKSGKPVSAAAFKAVFETNDTFVNIATMLGFEKGGIPGASRTNKAIYQAYQSLSAHYTQSLNFPVKFFLTPGDLKNINRCADDFAFAVPPDNETNLQLLMRVCGLREEPNEFTVFPDNVAAIIRDLYANVRGVAQQGGISVWQCFEWLCDHAPHDDIRRRSKRWLAARFFGVPDVDHIDNNDVLLRKISRVYKYLDRHNTFNAASDRLWWMLDRVPDISDRDFITAVNAIGRQDRADILQLRIGIEPEELEMPVFNRAAHERLSMLGAILARHPKLGEGLTADIANNDKAFYEWLLGRFSKDELNYLVGKVARYQLLMKITGLKREALEDGLTSAANEQLKFFYKVLCCIQTYPQENAQQRLQWLLDNYHKPEFKNILSWVLKNNPPAASLAMKCDFFRNLLPATETKLQRVAGGRQGALKAMRGLLNLLMRGIAPVLLFSGLVYIGGLIAQRAGAAMDFLGLAGSHWAASLAAHSLVVGLIIGSVTAMGISLENLKCETRADKVWAVASRLFFPLTLLLAIGQIIYTGYKDPEQNFSLRSCLFMVSKVFDRVPSTKALLTRFETVATVAAVHDKKVDHLQSPASEPLQVPEGNFASEHKEAIALVNLSRKGRKGYNETDAAEPLLSNGEGMTNV